MNSEHSLKRGGEAGCQAGKKFLHPPPSYQIFDICLGLFRAPLFPLAKREAEKKEKKSGRKKETRRRRKKKCKIDANMSGSLFFSRFFLRFFFYTSSFGGCKFRRAVTRKFCTPGLTNSQDFFSALNSTIDRCQYRNFYF